MKSLDLVRIEITIKYPSYYTEDQTEELIAAYEDSDLISYQN